LPASRELVTVPNIIFIITGVYFALVAGLQQGPPYAAIGAVLCFVAVGLSYEKEWFFSAPWRVAAVVFCTAVLVTQLASNFLAVNANGVIVASTIINGVLFLLLLGVLLATAKEMVSREAEEKEEEPETKKKKLTYEI
jgi:MFS superfamily sulfate permease-like transporter